MCIRDSANAVARVDDLSIPDVNANVADGVGGIREEYQIAGLQVSLGNGVTAVSVLRLSLIHI